MKPTSIISSERRYETAATASTNARATTPAPAPMLTTARRRAVNTRIGIVGFAVLGTIVLGPHANRDAAASPAADSDGPSLAAAEMNVHAQTGGPHVITPNGKSPAAALAPAFAADDVLGLPQGGAGSGAAGAGVVTTSIAVSPSAKTAGAGTQGGCAAGMIEVEGDYCPYVEQKCLRYLDPETKMRCAEFEPSTKCDGKTIHKKFCVDQYEFPNQVGEKPVIMKTWYEAQNACKSEGKRLCGESEWTLACEGQDRLPYPYGYERNSEACNIDKPHPDVNEKAIANPATRDAEVERLWQGEVSGSREACVSPYGVHDMTGNVDEWVVNESGHPYKSGLKGGYWGPVRDRCRPMTVAHNETFIFYQIGFRCCADEPSSAGDVTAPKGLGAGSGSKTAHPAAAPTGGSQVSALAGS